MASHMALKMFGLGVTITGFVKLQVFTWPPLKGYEAGTINTVSLGFDIWTPMFSIPSGTPHDFDQFLYREVEVKFSPKPRVVGSGPCTVSFLRWRKRSDGTYVKDGYFTLGIRCQGLMLDDAEGQFYLGKGSSGSFIQSKEQLEKQGYT